MRIGLEFIPIQLIHTISDPLLPGSGCVVVIRDENVRLVLDPLPFLGYPQEPIRQLCQGIMTQKDHMRDMAHTLATPKVVILR